jgi:hypothetical protein
LALPGPWKTDSCVFSRSTLSLSGQNFTRAEPINPKDLADFLDCGVERQER